MQLELCEGSSCRTLEASFDLPVAMGGFGVPCESNENPVFTNHITDLTKIETITPPGAVSDETIAQHSYIFIRQHGPVQSVPVYAPIDSELVNVVWVLEGDKEQHLLTIQVSCEVWIRLDPVNDVVDKILAVRSASPGVDSRDGVRVAPAVQFEAGELIGYSSGGLPECCPVWDFGVYNTSRPNAFANPARTQRASQRKYVDCPYDYFTEPLKGQYYALLGIGTCRRTSIDIPGAIAGEWFSQPPEADPEAFGTLAIGQAIWDGDRLAIGALNFSFEVEPSYVDPASVTTEHCYEGTLNGQRGYVYLKLLDELTLAEAHGAGS